MNPLEFAPEEAKLPLALSGTMRKTFVSQHRSKKKYVEIHFSSYLAPSENMPFLTLASTLAPAAIAFDLASSEVAVEYISVNDDSSLVVIRMVRTNTPPRV